MCIHVLVALVDGTVIDEEFPNHEVEEVETMVKETEDDLVVRVEIEDQQGRTIYIYKRKTHYVY